MARSSQSTNVPARREASASLRAAWHSRLVLNPPLVCCLIPDPDSPYHTLELRGDVEITPDDDYRLARHVGQKYGGTDFRYADRPGESRVGVILHPVRVNVTDLRSLPGS
jgi:hypothetical protein